MSSLLESESEEYSKYSAFDEAGNTTIDDPIALALQSKTAAASLSLADVNFHSQHARNHNRRQEYSRDEILYAISSPCSIGAMAWMVSSFMTILYGSSMIVYLNFCIPLFLGPYIIREQMPAQLLSSTRRKFNQLRTEANALSVKNTQLKGTVTRMQRQEYRLSAAEERFEHLCRRNGKDVVKMKQLARKNAELRQKIKVNVTGKKLEHLLTKMRSVDNIGSNINREKEIEEVVKLMKAMAGKNASSKFDEDEIHIAVTNSFAKNTKFTSTSNVESDTETRDSDSETNSSISNVSDIRKPYRQSRDEDSDDDTQSSIESKRTENDPDPKLDPRVFNRKSPRGSRQMKKNSGTADKPIDIEKLLFQKEKPKPENEKAFIGDRYSTNSGVVSSME